MLITFKWFLKMLIRETRTEILRFHGQSPFEISEAMLSYISWRSSLNSLKKLNISCDIFIFNLKERSEGQNWLAAASDLLEHFYFYFKFNLRLMVAFVFCLLCPCNLSVKTSSECQILIVSFRSSGGWDRILSLIKKKKIEFQGNRVLIFPDVSKVTQIRRTRFQSLKLDFVKLDADVAIF